MTSRKTSLDTIEPAPENPELQNSMGRNTQKPAARLGKEAQSRIGELLRSMYTSYLDQGVPPHLSDLVRRLGEQD
jgi:hypothetical protein